MGFVIDKITGHVYLFDIQGGGGATGTTASPYSEVNTFSQLPNPALNNGKIQVVRQGMGDYVLNRKDAGLYYSNGVVWTRLGDTPAFLSSNNFEVYDSVDNSKGVKFQTSGITTNQFRTIKIRDSNGTMAYLNDLNVKVDVSLFNEYTGITASNQFVGITGYEIYTGQTKVEIDSKQNKVYSIQLIKTGMTNVNVIIPIVLNWNVAEIYDTTYFLYSGGSRVYLKEDGIYEISYSLLTRNVDFGEKVIGTSIKKNGSEEILPNHIPVFIGSVVAYGGSNNVANYKFNANGGDYVELITFRIGQSGIINTVPNGTWLRVNKI